MAKIIMNNRFCHEQPEKIIHRNHMHFLKSVPPPHAPEPHPPVPPHERRRMFQIEMSEKDIEILTAVFHDEDTVSAAVEIICNAPPEIQVLVIQILKMIEETNYEG